MPILSYNICIASQLVEIRVEFNMGKPVILDKGHISVKGQDE